MSNKHTKKMFCLVLVSKATRLSMGNSTVFSTISSFSKGRATMTRASAINSIKNVGYRGMTQTSFRATEQVYGP